MQLILRANRMQEMELIVVCALLLTVTQASSDQGRCQYVFIRQPASELNCNPWPYVQQNNYTLSLHCDIIAPWDASVPQRTWFKRSDSSNVSHRIHFDDKYSGPTSSYDMWGLKMVTFTLRINTVTESDVGCYWCQIEINAPECTFSLINSSTFCLHEEHRYLHMTTCPTIPVNNSVTCAGNNTCGGIAEGNIFHPTSDLRPTHSSSWGSTVAGMSMGISSSSVRGDPSSSLNGETNNSDSTMVVTVNTHSISVSPSVGDDDDSSTSSELLSISSKLGVKIGVYAGIAVCFIMLVIIVILLMGVVILWRKKPRQKQKNTSQRTRTIGDDIVRPHSAHIRHTNLGGRTSTSGSHLQLLQNPQYNLPAQGDVEERPHDLTIDPQLSEIHHKLPLIPHHIRTLPLEGTSQEQSYESGRSGSNVVHYYHVLERPVYYNCTVGEDMEQRLILDSDSDWEDVNALQKDRYQKLAVTRETDSDIISRLQQEADTSEAEYAAIQQVDAFSPGGQRLPHVYKGLDQSTLEPVREYTKLVIDRTVDDPL